MRKFITVIVFLAIIIGVVVLYFEFVRPNFRAYVDEVPFEAKKGGAKYVSGRLKISAVHFSPDTTIMVIDLNAAGAGTYKLDSDNPTTGNVGAYFVNHLVYASNSRYTGTVTLTDFNLEKKQISGTFEFQAVQVVPPGSRSVRVTEGEFKNFPLN